MIYDSFQPSPELQSLVKCFWTLEVPKQDQFEKQLIVPDGCLEMIFILGDDIKRYTSETEFILQPRAMVLGQITQPFFVEPTGYVNSFAVRFYPYGLSNFLNVPMQSLENKETPISVLFDEGLSVKLADDIRQATDTQHRIGLVEKFLLHQMNSQSTVDNIIKSTIDAISSTNGSSAINELVKGDQAKRRQLERKFAKQVGMSPKQVGKIIRLQAALQMLLNNQSKSLTQIAYESDYYDQAHFIKDFREFTGITPKEFATNKSMELSTVLYKKQ